MPLGELSGTAFVARDIKVIFDALMSGWSMLSSTLNLADRHF
jgi:hypothetical protein